MSGLGRAPNVVGEFFSSVLEAPQAGRSTISWPFKESSDVRFGSKADVAECETNVCFTPYVKPTDLWRLGLHVEHGR